MERQLLREGIVEVDLEGFSGRVRQACGDALGDGSHPRDLARSEGAVHQAAQPVVIGGIQKHDRASHPIDVGPLPPALLLVVGGAIAPRS